jgi:hypothetical protein
MSISSSVSLSICLCVCMSSIYLARLLVLSSVCTGNTEQTSVVCTYVSSSICLHVFQSFHLSARISVLYLFVLLSVPPSVCSYVCIISVCSYIRLLSVCTSVTPSTCLSLPILKGDQPRTPFSRRKTHSQPARPHKRSTQTDKFGLE